MIDDHNAILRGYELLIEVNNYKYKFEISKANNIDESLELLEKNTNSPFQIVFLDINLPASEKYSLSNGEELGLRIKKQTNSKIIVLTSLNDCERISSILKNLEPKGFIIKDEISELTLLEAVECVLKDETYLSKKILDVQSSKLLAKNHDLDIFDLKIIYFLSIGEKIKNMPKHIPLSLPTIERRKRKISVFFGLNNTSNKELLLEAKKKGFI